MKRAELYISYSRRVNFLTLNIPPPLIKITTKLNISYQKDLMVSLIITELPYLRLNKIIREQSVIIHLFIKYILHFESITYFAPGYKYKNQG